LDKKGIVCLFVCLLVFDALSSHAVAAPIRYRKNKGPSLVQVQSQQNRKHYAIPDKVLLKQSTGSCAATNNKACGASKHKTAHAAFSRCYQTIGTSKATIDCVKTQEESVDCIVTKEVNVKTVTSHKTKFSYLENTKTEKRFLRHCQGVVYSLVTVHRAVKTLVPITVTIDVLKTVSVDVGNLTAHSACVRALKTEKRTIRVKTSMEALERKVTCTEGVIKGIKVVHENINQAAPRTVTAINKVSCPNSPAKSASCAKPVSCAANA